MAKTKSTDQAAAAKQNPRQEALKMAMQQIEKQFGKGAIMKLGERKQLEIETISTGALALDLALGVGGCLEAG